MQAPWICTGCAAAQPCLPRTRSPVTIVIPLIQSPPPAYPREGSQQEGLQRCEPAGSLELTEDLFNLRPGPPSRPHRARLDCGEP